jgi:hypothetical protein
MLSLLYNIEVELSLDICCLLQLSKDIHLRIVFGLIVVFENIRDELVYLGAYRLLLLRIPRVTPVKPLEHLLQLIVETNLVSVHQVPAIHLVLLLDVVVLVLQVLQLNLHLLGHS